MIPTSLDELVAFVSAFLAGRSDLEWVGLTFHSKRKVPDSALIIAGPTPAEPPTSPAPRPRES